LAFDLDDDGVMKEAIEQRRGRSPSWCPESFAFSEVGVPRSVRLISPGSFNRPCWSSKPSPIKLAARLTVEEALEEQDIGTGDSTG
jgi:hypothetical protein